MFAAVPQDVKKSALAVFAPHGFCFFGMCHGPNVLTVDSCDAITTTNPVMEGAAL
jgi:hypothetical protein